VFPPYVTLYDETKAAFGQWLPPDGTKSYEIIDNGTKQQPQPN